MMKQNCFVSVLNIGQDLARRERAKDQDKNVTQSSETVTGSAFSFRNRTKFGCRISTQTKSFVLISVVRKNENKIGNKRKGKTEKKLHTDWPAF